MEITCPYCFAKFMDHEVIFRANTGFTQNEIDETPSVQVYYETPDDMRPFRRFDEENHGGADQVLDEELIRFWKNRGQSSGYINADPKWDYPHIDPLNRSQYKSMITMKGNGTLTPDEDGFVRDSDGFVTRVIDKRSDPSIQMTRLCRFCHNPLPLPDYGKFPVIFISVVGVTSAGKTVYLNQLLMQFSTTMQNSGYRIGTSNLRSINEVVMPDHPLPSSTDDRIMRRPLAVTMTKEENAHEGMTIVFYDIAGENCVSGMDENGIQRDNSTVAHFIAHCDGLLFLIDPEQVFVLDSDLMVRNIADVIEVVKGIRAANPAHPSWDDIPVAAVLTKSDLLRTDLENNNLIFTHINRTDPKTGQARRGFIRDEFIQIHSYLSDKFRRDAGSISDSMAAFAQKAYFAVSAITCGVQSRFEKYQNSYSLTKENEKKFMSLKRWMQEWNRRTAEERGYFQNCPVKDRNDECITFPLEDPITEDNGRAVITEIWAENSQDCDAEKIYLNMWEIMAEIDLVGYPCANPNPRRIEEPIQWILWKKEFLEPYFQPENPGTKPLLCSVKRWERIVAECEARNIKNKNAFYEGENL